MFDNLKLQWFPDGECAQIAFDLKNGEIASIRKAIAAGVFAYEPHFDELPEELDDCMAGHIKINGVNYGVYTHHVGDPFNDTPRRRWTFDLDYRKTPEEELDGTLLADYEPPASLEHMWPDALPLMRALRPYMSSEPVVGADHRITDMPPAPDEIAAVFAAREKAWEEHRIVMGDGIGTWAWETAHAVHEIVQGHASRCERAFHILMNCECPESVDKHSFCVDPIAA